MKVYVLTNEFNFGLGTEWYKEIFGIFSTKEKAQDAKEKLRDWFQPNQVKLVIKEYEMDKELINEGTVVS